MLRYAALIASLAACATAPDETTTTSQDVALAFHREHLTGDLYHYTLVVPVGPGPNAAIQVHRVVRELAPFVPRPTSGAAMLVHGDFSDFDTSFLPGMAPYLAEHGIDVWGVDRRWTLATDDTSDFDGMGVTQELADLHAALDLARAVRGGDRVALVGFSHGAQLAYNYAASGATNIDGLVALDFFGVFSPADADLRAATCATSSDEYDLVAAGVTDAPNDFFITAGELDRDDPDGASPLLDGLSNRETILELLGRTYEFAPFTPHYELLALNDGGTAFSHTSFAAADAWLASAPPHQSMREAADLDARLCTDIPIEAIHQPLLYIGAADGIGAYGLEATTRVSSTDVTAFVVPGYGHGDLLFADDAARRVWQPLAGWLARH